MKTTRPTAPLLPALVLLALAAGCGAAPENDPAPLDRITFPSGLAAMPGGDLLVVSGNTDLTYRESSGGSVLRLDPSSAAGAVSGAVRIPSYGGEISVVDAAACGLPASEVLVPSRSSGALHRIAVGAEGLACADGCDQGLGESAVIAADPYGVAAVCLPGAPPRAFVSFLRGSSGFGVVAVVDLATGDVSRVPVQLGPTRSFAFDAETGRLFFTGSGLGTLAPLRWFELAGGCDPDVPVTSGGCPVGLRDLSTVAQGLELQGIALSNPQPGLARRAYVAARLYDAALAELLGGRPGFDVGAELLVLDLAEGPTGSVDLSLVRRVPLGLGASEVEVLPARAPRACPERPEGCPRRDVVAVSSMDAGEVALYDDDVGAVVKTIGADPTTGAPVLGRQPFALAAVPAGDGAALLYVGSFLESFVTAVRVPLDAPGAADPEPPGPETGHIGPGVP